MSQVEMQTQSWLAHNSFETDNAGPHPLDKRGPVIRACLPTLMFRVGARPNALPLHTLVYAYLRHRYDMLDVEYG
jgi:hypothetical protein